MKETAKHMLLAWIETALAQQRQKEETPDYIAFRSHHIHTHALTWGKRNFDLMYNPSTLQRRWREIRGKDSDLQDEYHIDSINKTNDGTEALWMVHPMTNEPLTNHETEATVPPT